VVSICEQVRVEAGSACFVITLSTAVPFLIASRADTRVISFDKHQAIALFACQVICLGLSLVQTVDRLRSWCALCGACLTTRQQVGAAEASLLCQKVPILARTDSSCVVLDDAFNV
jgi:hypothetical protein